MKTIAIHTLKGGVAKTTTTKALGDYFSSLGLRVLLVDLDYQSNLTDICGLEWGDADDDGIFSIPIYTMFKKRKPVPVPVPGIANMDILPNEWSAFPLNLELAGEYGRESVLKVMLKQVEKNYDICLIDCRPSYETIEINAIVAADYILVPSNPGRNSFKGVQSYFSALDLLKKNGFAPNIMGIVLTMFDEKRIESRELINDIQQNYPDIKIFKNFIKPYEEVRQAERGKKSILETKVRDAVIGLGEEILDVINIEKL